MLKWSETQLEQAGAAITTKEIMQQPELWEETLAIFEDKRTDLYQLLEDFQQEAAQRIRVIFTGAGTSAYVGDVVRPHLIRYGDTDAYQFESIPTTDIVAAPHDYLKGNQPTLLVSFARSGNSPESLAAVDLANKLVANIRHLIITCAADGQLAVNSQGDTNRFVLLMPARSNDKGFAMTGSFSCMTLATLLTFDQAHRNHSELVAGIVAMGNQALALEVRVQTIVETDFDRVVYLGSGSLSGLTREAQLKLLELTAGKIATVFDSSVGFRHGPKSFIDNRTIVFGFVSNDAYTANYDLDVLEEIKEDGIAAKVTAIAQNTAGFSGDTLALDSPTVIPDGFAALPFIIIGQVAALLTSVKVANKPDTPSPTGTVNRVVRGVVIHDLPVQ